MDRAKVRMIEETFVRAAVVNLRRWLAAGNPFPIPETAYREFCQRCRMLAAEIMVASACKTARNQLGEFVVGQWIGGWEGVGETAREISTACGADPEIVYEQK